MNTAYDADLREIIVPPEPKAEITHVVMEYPLPPPEEQPTDSIDRDPPGRDEYDRRYDRRWYH